MKLTERKRYTDKLKSQYWHSAVQSAHLERAQCEGNPTFVRVADLAIALAGANGHAPFKHGELTELLGKDYRMVDKAVADAVSYGLLAQGSNKRCLCVPRQIKTYAGSGSDDQQDARRLESCPTCTGVPKNPATCHPDRSRYMSLENGGLCESCYRKANRKPT